MDRICVECGNDLACEGYLICSDCMETLGHDADEFSAPEEPEDSPQPLDTV